LTSSIYKKVFSALLPDVQNPPLERSSIYAFLNDYLKTYPVLGSIGIRALFGFFFLAPVLFIYKLKTVGGLSDEDRERYMKVLEKHKWYPIRQAIILLKMVACIGYGGDKQFQKSIGYVKEKPQIPARAHGGSRNLIGDLRPEEVGFDAGLFRQGGEEECDFCIIGSGAGGAPVASILTRAGFNVVILEEGPAVKAGQFTPDYWDSTKLLIRDLSMTFAAGQSLVPIIQGCCVGGTTTINSAICWRIPDKVWKEWKGIFGPRSPLTDETLDRAFAKLEKELNVRPTQPEIMGMNNKLMELACKKLVLAGRPIERNEKDCEGSALCISGCPHGRKLSMENSYIPDAIKHGARLHPLCRADKLLLEGGRAVGVRGRLIEPEGKKEGAFLTVRARRGVVLAAGAIHSPIFLIRHGIARKNAGEHFMAHPGVSVAARFPEEVRSWVGATQGYETTHYREQGFKIETLSLPPEILMVRIPGIGKDWVKRLKEMPRLAVWGVALKAEGKGRVRPGLIAPRISFRFTTRDVRVMFEGAKIIGKMFFAAGAEAVYPGIYGMPDEVTKPEDLEELNNIPPDPRRYFSVATHLFATCRMGADPASSVVGPGFECHEVPGLFITDASALPTNLGVNPQLTIMAFSAMAAELLANTGRA